MGHSIRNIGSFKFIPSPFVIAGNISSSTSNVVPSLSSLFDLVKKRVADVRSGLADFNLGDEDAVASRSELSDDGIN
jgi:hypothetical protein